MELECAIQPDIDEVYPFEITNGSPSIVDWGPMIPEILLDLQKGESAGIISAKFHNTLTEIIVAVARKVGEPRVLLNGWMLPEPVSHRTIGPTIIGGRL